MRLSHSFSVEVAKQFDVTTALLLQHFSFWYLKNKADDNQFFKGDYWVRMKADVLCEYFPYLTKRQLRYAIEKLVENKLIKTGEFNQKKNDRTKWYSFTKKGKNLLNISTDKIVTNKGYKIVTPTDKIVTSIYKEEDIEYRYSLLREKLEKNAGLIELVAMQNKLKPDTVKANIDVFLQQSKSVKEFYNNDTQFFKHFQRWIRTQNLSDTDCKQEVTWFINAFNKISKGDFVVTEGIKCLFVKQLANGFSGQQMVKAIENLYSSNPKNQWHIKNSFKFATPSYLLKEGNLNKYINVKY